MTALTTVSSFGWKKESSVEDWLYAEPWRFEFYQAVRLLESFHPRALLTAGNQRLDLIPVRFRSRVSFDFPASEVHEIQRNSGTPEITVNFLGLAGALGPLPAAYSEMVLAAAAKKDHAASDFLDIFNNRLIGLFYRARQAHFPALTARSPQEGAIAGYLFSLIGLGLPAMRSMLGIPARSLLHYTGLLARLPRTVAGLERILADYFAVPVRVKQFIGGWRPLDRSQWTTLGAKGSNQILAAGVVLGTRVWDDSKSVSIVLGPLSLQVFREFLPGGWRHKALAALARFYLDGRHDAEARLLLNQAEVPRTAIGHSRLGFTSWLLQYRFKGRDHPFVRVPLES